MLLRLLVARLGNRDDAEDTLQDMWLRIEQLSVQPIAQPAAFLYRVAANLATDRRIAAGRRGGRESAWLEVQPRAHDFPDAERVLVARDCLRTVEATIAAMPDRMATALRLFRIENRSQRAIAEELGITVSGVEKLLQRAYRLLQDGAEREGADRTDGRRLTGERGTGHAR